MADAAAPVANTATGIKIMTMMRMIAPATWSVYAVRQVVRDPPREVFPLSRIVRQLFRTTTCVHGIGTVASGA